MSDDLQSPAEKWDPLTAPNWNVSEEVELTIAPPVEKYLHQSPETARTIPQPPDVDQILRGEYTGWVPIIKPGDTLQDANRRFEIDNQLRAQSSNEVTNDQQPDEIVEVIEPVHAEPEILLTIPTAGMAPEDVEEINDLIEDIKAEPTVYVKDFYPNFSSIAENPDTVVSPSQALDEARRRIEQMRANLQVNLSRVAQSFDHPIFESEKIAVPEIVTSSEPIQVEEVQLDENVHIPMPTAQAEVIEEVFTESVTTEQATYQEPVREQVTTSVATEQKPKEDHSLELVIMRDEIKDLRDRLDASQKLIETLMERLANLAELALKRN